MLLLQDVRKLSGCRVGQKRSHGTAGKNLSDHRQLIDKASALYLKVRREYEGVARKHYKTAEVSAPMLPSGLLAHYRAIRMNKEGALEVRLSRGTTCIV